MRHSILAGAIVITCASSAFAQTLPGPSADKPFTENWAPSKWGAEDRAGSANHTKNPAQIKRALATVKQNKSITIGKYYHREAPAFGPRGWQMSIPGTPTGGPFGKNALVYHDELVTTEIGQIQTQFDGPGHIGVNTSKGPMFYNGASRGMPTSAAPAAVCSAWARWAWSTSVNSVSSAAWWCSMPWRTASRRASPASAEMLPIPKKAGDTGIVTADDVQGHRQGARPGRDRHGRLRRAAHRPGQHLEQRPLQDDDRRARAAARAKFAEGEPGFGISACEYMA